MTRALFSEPITYINMQPRLYYSHDIMSDYHNHYNNSNYNNSNEAIHFTIGYPRRMCDRVAVVGLCVCVCPDEISFYVRLHQLGIVPTVYK